MITKIPSEGIYTSERDWLISRHHFSFESYYDPDKMNYGVLRVFNDDIIKAGKGFGTHPHQEMEIVSYCISGEMTHNDSTGFTEILKRGDVQHMSAGTGISHSEMNNGATDVRFLQLWITPKEFGIKPRYASKSYTDGDRLNKLLHIVSGPGGAGDIKINQDANIYVSEIEGGGAAELNLGEGRQAYIVCIEGEIGVNGTELSERDAAEVTDETTIKIITKAASHIIIVEMSKE